MIILIKRIKREWCEEIGIRGSYLARGAGDSLNFLGQYHQRFHHHNHHQGHNYHGNSHH